MPGSQRQHLGQQLRVLDIQGDPVRHEQLAAPRLAAAARVPAAAAALCCRAVKIHGPRPACPILLLVFAFLWQRRRQRGRQLALQQQHLAALNGSPPLSKQLCLALSPCLLCLFALLLLLGWRCRSWLRL